MVQQKKIGQPEWLFDALDLRPVERWLARVPTVPFEPLDEPRITALAQPSQRLVDSYLDTVDWRMARAGFIARTCRRGRQDEVTLKTLRPTRTPGAQNSPAISEELPAAGVSNLAANGPVGRRINAVAGRRPLHPVLSVRTRRRSFSLRIDGAPAADIALDETEIVVGNGQRPMQLRRVVIHGRPEWADSLAPLVRHLRLACGLQPASLSKFEAGLLAGGIEVPSPPDLGATDIAPESNLGDLAFAVLRRQLGLLRAKEPGPRLGEDPEELHDMRVATRRLRAACDLFANVLPVRARGFRNELGWMADELGGVRDLDVQLEAHAAMVESGQGEPWTALTLLLTRERDAARTSLLAALDSVRWERLLSGLTAMVQQGPFRRSTATRVAALVAVPDLVHAHHSAVVKAARRAKRSGAAADFHRLRIRCKRLRYSLEFSAEVYDMRTARYTRQLARLQDQLGLLQDAEVAAARLSYLAGRDETLPASTIFVMGGAAERHRQEFARLLAGLPDELTRVSGRAWQELATTMERDRAQILALVPPARPTLRALPPPLPSADPPTPALTGRVLPELVRAANGGESPA